MYVVTGGAGFIGSNIVAQLDKTGAEIVVVDWLGSNDHKWRNIAKRRLSDLIVPHKCLDFIRNNASNIKGVYHMGAISATTEKNVDLIVESNIRLSIDLWTMCSAHQIPFVYASSAATYGNGAQGFIDRFDDTYLASLRPLNPYGWSKHVFDRYVLKATESGMPTPPRWAGLKFFNVYGPNESHKEGQRSVAIQLVEQINEAGKIKLFRSDNPDYADGEQLRDFVWVGDCASIAVWMLQANTAPSGLYNIGSGKARSFLDKANIVFHELGREPDIEFIDLPTALKGKYQYFTEASMAKLNSAGYNADLTSLESGIKQYVEILSSQDPYI